MSRINVAIKAARMRLFRKCLVDQITFSSSDTSKTLPSSLFLKTHKNKTRGNSVKNRIEYNKH